MKTKIKTIPEALDDACQVIEALIEGENQREITIKKIKLIVNTYKKLLRLENNHSDLFTAIDKINSGKLGSAKKFIERYINFFIRDGKEMDSAGVLNTTESYFIKKG